MRIIITGTPGTGKSQVARELSKGLSLELIDLKKVVHRNHLLGARHEVDIKKLARALVAELKGKKGYVIEGHLACEMKLPADYIFILRSSPEALQRRFKKRRYPGKKIEENIEAELLDYCAERVSAVYGRGVRALEIDTSKRTVKGSCDEIQRAIRLKKKKCDTVTYSLIDYLGLIRR